MSDFRPSSDPPPPQWPPVGPSPVPPVPGPAFGPYAQGGSPWPPPATTGPPLPPAPGTTGYPGGTGYPLPADISNYAPPKPRTSWIVAGVAALVLLGLVIGGMLLRAATPSPAPTTSPSATSSTSSLPGLPFTMPSDPSSSGRWEVVDRDWTSTGVSIRVRVYCTAGRVTYGFLAYAKNASDATSPISGDRVPQLTTGSLRTGEVADGYIFLQIPHAESTLFLTTSSGRAISALPIRA